EELACTRVPRVAFEPRMVHPRNGRVAREEAGDFERAPVLLTDPHRERLHPAVQQEGRVRVERAPEMAELARDRLDERGATAHCARDDVVVAIHIFGAT